MRWLCFLLASAAAPAPSLVAQDPTAKPLRFDLSALPATRDSFVFFLDGKARGFAVWQYETRSTEMSQQVVYTASSRFEPVEEESLHVVLDRQTGAPVASFHHIDLFSPTSDTVMVEHDLDVKHGAVEGRRRVGTKNGQVNIIPVNVTLPARAVWSNYELYAAAVTNAAPGDTLTGLAYREFDDSVAPLVFVAEQPTTIHVPAGRFEVLPLRSGNFRLYVTRTVPRRVVKGETVDGKFSFELAHSAPVVPSQP